MSDVVRDLVVSLSLDAGEFTRNMRAINASIKEAESSFSLAGAGVDKFGSSLGGQLAKAQMLEQTYMLQSAAVRQYSAHLSEANNKMLATEGYLAKYSARLAAAKSRGLFGPCRRFPPRTASGQYQSSREHLLQRGGERADRPHYR